MWSNVSIFLVFSLCVCSSDYFVANITQSPWEGEWNGTENGGLHFLGERGVSVIVMTKEGPSKLQTDAHDIEDGIIYLRDGWYITDPIHGIRCSGRYLPDSGRLALQGVMSLFEFTSPPKFNLTLSADLDVPWPPIKNVPHYKPSANPKCNFEFYGQVSNNSENHARFPVVTGKLYSFDCGVSLDLVLSVAHSQLELQALLYAVIASALTFWQLASTIFQTRNVRSTATAQRISLMTLVIQGVLDSYMALIHITLAILVASSFIAFTFVAILDFSLCSVVEMQFMLMIWKAARPAGATLDQSRRDLTSFYVKVYGLLLGGLILWMMLGSTFCRPLLAFMYSFWLPQIVRSALTDSKRFLSYQYIWTMTITRLFFPLYFFAYPYNFLGMALDIPLCIFVVIYTIFQGTFLTLQNVWSPRWFIPVFLLPPKYDYQRAIPDIVFERDEQVRSTEPGDLESGMARQVAPISQKRPWIERIPFISRFRRERDQTRYSVLRRHGTFQCAICMESLDTLNESYACTPCDHLFHSECLENWMEVKLECPTCRSSLPPV